MYVNIEFLIVFGGLVLFCYGLIYLECKFFENVSIVIL